MALFAGKELVGVSGGLSGGGGIEIEFDVWSEHNSSFVVHWVSFTDKLWPWSAV
jgi:hypothetical protein